MKLTEVPVMFEDFQKLRNSIEMRNNAVMVVKLAALEPDKIIEEEAEVTKNIKLLSEQVLKPNT